MDFSELNTTQRIALVAFGIMAGETFTTAELAKRLGLTHVGAWRMMSKLSYVLPIYQNDDFVWLKLDREPEGRGIDSTSTRP